jgi:hypothetical protein
MIAVLARLSPRETAPAGLREVAQFLDRPPSDLAAAADAVGLLVGTPLVVVALLVGRPSLLLVAAGAGYGATVLVRGGVIAAASARRSRALGTAPALVGRAVLRARVEPTAEAAAAFAAGTEGRLGDRLAEHVRRARGTPRSGLATFADAWREGFPALHRALTLVAAAAAGPADERDRSLDRAMDAVLDGTRDRASEAADGLRGPATALYAFGVLLPLALVGVLPAAGAAGFELTLPAVVAVYDIALPAALLCASGWLLARRPVAFPPAAVDERHTPEHPWLPVVAGLLAAGVAATLAGLVLPQWTRPVAAAGSGAGVALVVRFRPVVSVRERADELDAALPDALYLVGRRVADGVAVERAVADAADELDGVAGEVFEAAARRQRQLRVGVEPAFAGEYGALDGVPSRRAEAAARLLGVAASAGPPAGRALVETADHLEALRRVEAEARRDLGRVTSTLGNTAAFFGPLVGGATVALAARVASAESLEGGGLPVADLGLAVGAYVLLLAVVLAALSVGLSRGLDRATVGHRVGGALCAATVTYLVAFRAAATAAGGL